MAASGGTDSTALLHLATRLAAAWAPRAAGNPPAVMALHVQHGLMPEAERWLARVRTQAARWGAGFAFERIGSRPARGDSIEAWAREERYAALVRLARAHGVSLVLLAQHRRDQAETVLVQALRSGAPAGLAAMPREFTREGVRFVRPWLAQPREAIEAYVRRHRLRPVSDPSNADPRFVRARLRAQVWPALLGAFAQAEVALAAVAGRAAESALLEREVALVDLPQVSDGAALHRARWLLLPEARRRNALRAWLSREIGAGFPGTLVERLMHELPTAPSGRWPAPRGTLELRRGRLAWRGAAATGHRQTAT